MPPDVSRWLAGLALTLLLAACGGVRSGANLCALVPEADAVAALGVALQTTEGSNAGHLECTWTGVSAGDGLPRTMSAALWRESALRRAKKAESGALYFEDELRLLERDYPRTRVIGGPAEATVIGFGEIGDERFVGGLVARKRGDVLVMRIAGADPAAFEAAARQIVDAM